MGPGERVEVDNLDRSPNQRGNLPEKRKALKRVIKAN